ncbi:MAG: hypothetical protein ABRQ38_30350 [Candidatus Eremiobacterota bacterium]
MKFSVITTILIVIFTMMLFTYSDSMAFVSKPVDTIPGVKLPTPNPDVPTLPPRPTAKSNSKQVTPLYIITTPTANATPLFQDIKEDTPDTKEGNRHVSSTVKIILFLLGAVLIAGGLIFFYKTKG